MVFTFLYIRFKHAQLRANSESVAFYSAGGVEKDNADRKLFSLVDVQLTLTNWEFWLNGGYLPVLVSQSYQ